jgi:hypothetical protein
MHLIVEAVELYWISTTGADQMRSYYDIGSLIPAYNPTQHLSVHSISLRMRECNMPRTKDVGIG